MSVPRPTAPELEPQTRPFASDVTMSRNLRISLLNAGLPIFGFLTLLVPLALWVSWSNAIFFGTLIFGACTVSGFLFCATALHRMQPDTPAEENAGD